MLGEPSNVDGQCNACLFIADNYGDGSATIQCQLAPNHKGLHQEQFEREGGMVTITWVTDERRKCDHGCGQWHHDHHAENVACPRHADDHEFSDCPYCNPDTEGKICAVCGKTYYWEQGHLRHCQRGTGRPEDTVPCPACSKGPGDSCDGPMSHPSRVMAHDTQTTKVEEDEFAP